MPPDHRRVLRFAVGTALCLPALACAAGPKDGKDADEPKIHANPGPDSDGKAPEPIHVNEGPVDPQPTGDKTTAEPPSDPTLHVNEGPEPAPEPDHEPKTNTGPVKKTHAPTDKHVNPGPQTKPD